MSELSVDQQVAVAEQLQNQLAALERQHERLQQAALELRATRKAIDALGAGAAEDPVLVPLGSGAFTHAKIVSPDRVLAPVGSGILVEETKDAASERLAQREKNAADATARLEADMAKLEDQLRSLLTALQQAQAAAGGS